MLLRTKLNPIWWSYFNRNDKMFSGAYGSLNPFTFTLLIIRSDENVASTWVKLISAVRVDLLLKRVPRSKPKFPSKPLCRVLPWLTFGKSVTAPPDSDVGMIWFLKSMKNSVASNDTPVNISALVPSSRFRLSSASSWTETAWEPPSVIAIASFILGGANPR